MTDLEKAKQLDWELQCYGCSEARLKEVFADCITSRMSGHAMVVAGLLSDAQEELEREMNEDARQTLNWAKWVLFKYVVKDED